MFSAMMKSTNHLAAAVLLLTPAISVELLSGNSSTAEYFTHPLEFITLTITYGAALLIRETVVRWRRGAVSMLILSSAYGMINEGLGTKGFFNPHFYALANFGENYGRWFGVNVLWALHISIVHAVYSVLVPIVLVSVLFPGKGRWLGTPAYVTLTVAFVLDAVFVLFAFPYVKVPFDITPYLPYLLKYFLSLLALILLVIFVAWKLPIPGIRKWTWRPNAPLLFVGGIFWAFGFNLVPRIAHTLGAPPGLCIALLFAFAFLIVWLFFKLPDPSETEKVALALGLLAPWFFTATTHGLLIAIILLASLITAASLRASIAAKRSV
jgi:hypothetical protein